MWQNGGVSNDQLGWAPLLPVTECHKTTTHAAAATTTTFLIIARAQNVDNHSQKHLNDHRSAEKAWWIHHHNLHHQLPTSLCLNLVVPSSVPGCNNAEGASHFITLVGAQLMQQVVAGGGTVSTQYLHNIYTISAQYLHNICTISAHEMLAKCLQKCAGMWEGCYVITPLSGLTHCSLFSVFANIQNLINIQHNGKQGLVANIRGGDIQLLIFPANSLQFLQKFPLKKFFPKT